MAAIQNINNNIIGTITTRPNAENVQGVIEFNDKLIKLYTEKKDKLENLINSNEKYVNTLDNHIKLTKENINLRKDYIQTVKESKELGEKRISLLQDTNNKLQALLDRNSSKIDLSDAKSNSLIVTDSAKSNMPTSYKPSPAQLKVLANQTNDEVGRDIYIKNVRELGGSLIYRRTTFVPNTTPLIKEYKENYDDLILLRKELIPKIKSNEEIINKNKEILQNYSASITGEKIGSRKEENAIAILIEKNAALEKVNSVYINKMVEANNVYMDIIKIPLMEQEKINKADELLVNNNKSSASELYNQILISRPNSEKEVDENYRPLDEQLRQASKLYMNLQKIQNTLKIDLLSEKDLVVSCIAAHTTGKYSVSKNEVINMIDNGFFYSSIN